ncbi:hypothetical protein RB195_000443 [Necator americanus]
MRGGKRRERRSKKTESSPQLNRGEITSNNKQRYENTKDLKDVAPELCLKYEEKLFPNGIASRRSSPPSQEISRALIRLYAYARLKSLQNSIVAGQQRSLKSMTSATTTTTTPADHDNLESFKPLERHSLLSSLPQLSLQRFGSREFEKMCLSRDSGYLTGSPWEFSSSTETLRRPKSPTVVTRPRKRVANEPLPSKRRFHASHGDILHTSAVVDSSTQTHETIESFLSRNVYKSKCVTSLFEAANAGLEALIDDVLAEFDRWFVGRKMLIVASELHFSVPLDKRSRKLEQILKQQMLRSLLENNRRILYLKGNSEVLPIHMAEARTEENICSDSKLQAVQGVYQRCYHKLLPFVHSATPTWHAPYWKLSQTPVRPQKSAFLEDDSTKFRTHSFISFNIIGLSIFGIKHQSHDVLA